MVNYYYRAEYQISITKRPFYLTVQFNSNEYIILFKQKVKQHTIIVSVDSRNISR